MAVRKAEIPRHIKKTALDLAASEGWRRLTLHRIADAAKVPLVELYRHYPSKLAILAGLSRQIDEEVLSRRDLELASEPPRDRLFSVLMQRFEALNPYKAGLREVLRESACDPVAVCCGSRHLARSMAWMLEAAEIGSSGLCGLLRVKGLAAVYLAVMRVWFDDETEDMSRTMAALDRHLRRVDSLLGAFRRRRREEGQAPEAGPSPAGGLRPAGGPAPTGS